jgi:HK97 family phage prohead protease
MPYDETTLTPHQGRMVRESVAPGAFAGIERRANRVRVNRDHDAARTVGRAIAFHPNRPEGLVAEVRIAQTPLGEETLTLADEELLDASAAFLPMPGGEEWRSKDERRFTRLWLGHIAMTPDPAYTGANVLSVRSQQPLEPGSQTPSLDALRAFLLSDRYAGL